MARVVVVDDSPEIREVLRAVLETEGHEVVEARDGREALRLLMGREDVVVLDIMMPGIDGFDVLSALNAQGADRPKVIVLSAKSDESARHRALLEGADAFLSKPFDSDDLLQEIERVRTRPDAALEEHRQHELYVSRLLSMLESTSGPSD